MKIHSTTWESPGISMGKKSEGSIGHESPHGSVITLKLKQTDESIGSFHTEHS